MRYFGWQRCYIREKISLKITMRLIVKNVKYEKWMLAEYH